MYITVNIVAVADLLTSNGRCRQAARPVSPGLCQGLTLVLVWSPVGKLGCFLMRIYQSYTYNYQLYVLSRSNINKQQLKLSFRHAFLIIPPIRQILQTRNIRLSEFTVWRLVVNDPNLIIWKVLSTVNRMEMEFGRIYLFG